MKKSSKLEISNVKISKEKMSITENVYDKNVLGSISTVNTDLYYFVCIFLLEFNIFIHLLINERRNYIYSYYYMIN